MNAAAVSIDIEIDGQYKEDAEENSDGHFNLNITPLLVNQMIEKLLKHKQPLDYVEAVSNE